MKNNLKENRGITLVALIITIIVLLILAVVTINAVSEGKLFTHANNAASAYGKAAGDENTMISNYLIELKKHDSTTSSELAGTYYVLGNPPERQGSLTIDVDSDNKLILNNNIEDALPPEYYTVTENSIIIDPPGGEGMVIPCFKTPNAGRILIMDGIVFAKSGTTNFFTSNLSGEFSGKTYVADLNAYDDAEKIVFGSTTFDLYTEDKGDWNSESILHGTCGMLGNYVLIVLDSSYQHGTYNARLLTPSNGNATLTSETNLGYENNDIYYIYNLLTE